MIQDLPRLRIITGVITKLTELPGGEFEAALDGDTPSFRFTPRKTDRSDPEEVYLVAYQRE